MRPFSNNLKKGDEVMLLVRDAKGAVSAQKRGVVDANPRTSTRMVGVKFASGFKRVDVMDLRLIVDGKPEDCAPVDGDPPEPGRAESQDESDPARILKDRKARNQARMDELESEFKGLRLKNERIDRALEALSEDP